MLLLRTRALLCIALAVGATLGGCSYDDTNGPGNRVDVSPANDTIVTGATITPDDTLRLEAEVVSEAGVPVPNAPVTWTSSEPTVATVDSAGLVRAVGYGTTRVTARSGDREAVAIVTVLREEGGSVGIDSVFTQISAGRDFTCATTSLGRAYCWGIDSTEQLGAVETDTVCINSFEQPEFDEEEGRIRNDYECSLLPVRVQSDRTIKQAIAGGQHGCIIADNGESFCFGQADSGQTGNGITVVDIDVPVLVTSALQFDGITGGEIHTCGILAGGGGVAYCWGYDGNGQLGNLVRASSTTPIPVEGGIVWRQVSAGRVNTCGVAVVGFAYCWGDNSAGQLGNPAFIPQSDVPVQVQIGGPLTFISISVGGPTACGVVAPVSSTSGTVYCWGAGGDGQLGNGALTSSATPVQVPGLSGIRQVAVGETHVCAISEETSGNLYCWGRYNLDRLRPTPPNEPRDFIGAAPVKIGTVTFTAISSGRRHSCGVTEAGAAYCWGSNVLGPFGDGLQALLRTEPQRVQTPR